MRDISAKKPHSKNSWYPNFNTSEASKDRFNYDQQFFAGKNREEFYSNLKNLDDFTSKNLDYYDFMLRRRTDDLKEILNSIQQKKSKLSMYTFLALLSSILSLMAVTMWFYQIGFVSSPFLPFSASVTLLIALNIFVSLKIRSLLYSR